MHMPQHEFGIKWHTEIVRSAAFYRKCATYQMVNMLLYLVGRCFVFELLAANHNANESQKHISTVRLVCANKTRTVNSINKFCFPPRFSFVSAIVMV